MDTDQLVRLGLTKREARAYVALLKMEEGSAGEIAEMSKEDRTNIYDSLNGLVKKGLAGCSHHGKHTVYRVAPPERLKEYIDEKNRVFDQLFPDLNEIYKSYRPKAVVETYSGKEGIKTVLRDLLKEGKSFVGFGATDKLMVLMPEFGRTYMREREKKRIFGRQFCAQGEKVLLSKYSEFKRMPRQFAGPATTLIYGDKVLILLWFMDPQVSILIKSKEASRAYRNQFEFMWKILK